MGAGSARGPHRVEGDGRRRSWGHGFVLQYISLLRKNRTWLFRPDPASRSCL
jgi:hypothetical protein